MIKNTLTNMDTLILIVVHFITSMHTCTLCMLVMVYLFYINLQNIKIFNHMCKLGLSVDIILKAVTKSVYVR